MCAVLPPVQVLIAAGGSVSAGNAWNQTALHWASTNGNTGAVAVLLEHGASIEEADSDGNRAIHHAAAEGQVGR